jgi:membrane fusion protein (multidrug efflux system)
MTVSPLRSRAVWITIAVVLALIGYKTISIMRAIADGANHQMPPEGVTTFELQPRTLETTVSAVASLAAVQGAELSAEEAGRVAKINFDSGSLVNAGDVLVQLDTSVESAQLKSAEAKAQLAQVNLRRVRALRPSNAASQSDLDAAEATAKQAEADANAVRALIERKTISAPFAGRAGIRRVNAGDFVMQGDKIVPLHSLSELYADLYLPQQNLGIVKIGQTARLTSDAVSGAAFTGTITAIDPQVSETTRNFRVQATFKNEADKLRPGMFGTVSIITGAQENLLAIPVSSVSYAPYGNSVFVMAKIDDGKGGTYDGVEQRIVHLGAARGDLVEVVSGLEPGLKVVSSGAFKLMPKMAVVENNSVTPGDTTDPKVEDN